MSKVGTGYLFAFYNPDLGEPGDYIGMYVVERKFFEENGHIESVHFTDTREMPEEFWEDMESSFLVESAVMTKDEVRAKMLELGFEESEELAALNNDGDE